MPMLSSRGVRDPNQEVLNQGAAGLLEGLGAFIIRNRQDKSLNEDRTRVEQQIRDAPDYQSALTAIDNAPYKVKDKFNEQLLSTAKDRFPEQDLINVLDSKGNVKQIPQAKNRPFTDEELSSQGFERAQQFGIVSFDENGDIQIHDTALGRKAAEEDLGYWKGVLPGRRFQVAQGPELSTFEDLAKLQNDRRNSKVQNQRHLTPEELRMSAEIKTTIQNDPLATEDGATVLTGRADDISKRFNEYFSKYKDGAFTLDDPENRGLVHSGIGIASQATARGYPWEKAIDLGVNYTLANSVVADLLKNGALTNSQEKETMDKFGVNGATLHKMVEQASNSPKWASVPEFDPNSKDPAIYGVPSGGKIVLFVKINGRMVPYGKQDK